MSSDTHIAALESDLDLLRQRIEGHDSWIRLIQAGDAAAALREIESCLAQSGDTPDIRLWWIHCQLALRQVPVMALAAPLEQLHQHFENISSITPNVPYVHLTCALQLFRKGQILLGSKLLHRGMHYLWKCESFDTPTKESIQKKSATLIRKDLANVKIDSKEQDDVAELEHYLSGIEDLKKLPLNLPKPIASDSIEESPSSVAKGLLPDSRHSHFSSKSIIDIATKELEDTEQAEKDPWNETPRKDKARTKWATQVISATFAGLLILYFFLSWKSDDLGSRIAIAHVSENSALTLPTIDQREQFRKTESKRIVSDLKALSERLKNISTIPESSPSEQTTTTIPTQVAETSDIETPAPPATSPIENTKPASDGDLYYEPGTFGDINQNQPRLDPREILSTQIEQLDINPNVNRAPINNESLQEDHRGRRFNKPIDSAEDSAYRDRKDLTGQPLRSHEVEILDPPLHYRIISATDVLSHPSFVARALTRLEPEATVLVVAKMGQWLELRSAQGRTGYVLAQDAVEAPDVKN